jgi:hypothetical protein
VFGTDVGRHYFGDNIWVDMAFKDLTPESNVVIADVRFPSEAQRVADYDGANWRIERPGVGPVNNHKSESALVAWEFDKYIKNDFNLEKLEADLHELMSFYDIPRITTPVSA